jgi:hypothetical protein
LVAFSGSGGGVGGVEHDDHRGQAAGAGGVLHPGVGVHGRGAAGAAGGGNQSVEHVFESIVGR